ncbi:MAG: hypothetical protein WA194_07845 [Patescibacteria group bacterium]
MDDRKNDTVFSADFLDAFGFRKDFAIEFPDYFSVRAHLVGNGFSVVRHERYRDLPRVDSARKRGFENVFRRNEGNGAFAAGSAAEDEEGSGHMDWQLQIEWYHHHDIIIHNANYVIEQMNRVV